MRDVPGEHPARMAAAWVDRLSPRPDEAVRALDLYAGDHWTVVRSCLRDCDGRQVAGWVYSAGYGLVSADAPLIPYSATFSSGHPDCVVRGLSGVAARDAMEAWWAALAAWSGPVAGAPRSFQRLAAGAPGIPIVVIASTPYLLAAAHDLRAAATTLDSPDLLTIVSAGTRRLPGLERHLLSFGAPLQRLLGGGLRSLNARVVRYLLDDGVPIRHSFLQAAIDLLGAQVPASPPITARRRQSDAEVAAFIKAELQADPQATHSALLARMRRQRGLPCEQKRFRGIYIGVAADMARAR